MSLANCRKRIEQSTVFLMEIFIRRTADEIGDFAADMIEPFVKQGATLGLATGSTPSPTYQALIRKHREEGLSFADCDAFLLDEYYGIDQQHEQSYWSTIRRELTAAIDIDDAAVHSLSSTAANPAEEAATYETMIKDAGGVDIQLLGIGANGHIAFNEPTSSLSSRTRLIDLRPRTIADNARFFDSENEVPRQAMTQGIGTILEAKKIIIIATGAAKAEAVQAMIEGPLSSFCPASSLQMHNDVCVLLDEEAADRLGDVEFYKEIDAYWN